MSATKTPPDVKVTSNGIGFYTVTPVTVAGRDWINEHANVPDWAWLGNSFHMDNAHLVSELVDGMAADGLRVAA